MKDFKKNTLLDRPTDELTNEINGCSDISEFLTENQDLFFTPDISELLLEMIKRKNITKSALAAASGMSEVYLYQILNGSRTPSRDRMICLCIGLKCTLDETQELLKEACFALLYTKIRREAIIIFAIENGWDIHRLNDMLYELEETTMF